MRLGYYADELAMEEERQGNRTIITKNPSKGFHLNNLSYVGPVIMGFGGKQHIYFYFSKLIMKTVVIGH